MSSKTFDFITKDGDHVHLTKEQIKEQKKIEESANAEAAKHEVEVRKEELVDLLGLDVVSKCYKAKLQYDKYYYKMLNRRAKSRIINCDVLTRKGLITLKVYKEDGTSEVISNFKANDLHLGRTLLPLNTLKISQMKCCTLYKKSSLNFIKVLGLPIMPGPSVPFCLLKLTRET
ncbi:hypothetical protein Tco_0653830 [Tanacetum coccineum]|uniref:Uncharacterized protein n=1 Tax=Tanacetum coccineum TaxID=301880 RepID=A0ABQ4X1L5_9ASTR